MIRLSAIGLLAAISVAAPAQAAVFDVNPTSATLESCDGYSSCSTFTSRGIYFLANETFTISAAGFVGNIFNKEYIMSINADLGETAALGTLLASATQSLTGGVYQINWVDIAFTFNAGQEYHVNFGATDEQNFSDLYDADSWGDGADQENLGILTLMDGTSYGGFGAGAGNSWLPHFQFDVETAPPADVPLPGAGVVLLAGLGALGAAARRRKG